MPETSTSRLATARVPLVIGAVVIGGLIGYAGMVGMGGMGAAGGDPACRPAVATAKKIAPLAHGEVAALTMATKPLKLPDLAFEDSDGKLRKLSDWRGKTVPVNLWATWCVPCRREMPALDALQGRLGSHDFEVVAVNLDTRDPHKPLAFLKDENITHLARYSDDTAHVFEDLKAAGKAFGMPTTLIVDPAGCEIGNMAGPAEWASDDAVKLVSAAASGS
jgi:thiol-disulfide isomerase/thioredoxin